MDLHRFELIGSVTNVQPIAINRSIRELQNLRKLFGGRRWRKLKGIATVKFDNGMIFRAELHWYEAHGVGRRKNEDQAAPGARAMTRRKAVRFLVCIRNDGYPEALELRKLYRVVPDPKAAKVNFVRVIDESGEDYLYPKDFFAPVRLAPPTRRALAAT